MATEIRRRALIVVIAGVPIFFWTGTYSRFDVPKLALLTLGVAIAAASALAGGFSWSDAWRALRVPIAVILVPLTLAAIAGPYRGFSILGDYEWFQGVVPYALFALLAVLALGTFQKRREIATPIVFAAMIVGAYATFQQFGIEVIEWAAGFQGSTIGNPNFVGGYLAIALPLAVAEIVEQRPNIWNVAAVAAIGAGLWAAGSLGGFVAAAVGLALFLAIALGRRIPGARSLGMAAAVMSIVALVAIGYFVVPSRIEGRPDSVEQRALWWRGAAAMFADHPAFGRGPDSYAIEGVRYRTTAETEWFAGIPPTDPHSVFFDFLASCGFLGGAGFLTLCAWIFWRISRLPAQPDLLHASFGAAAVAYVVQSFVSIDELSLRSAAWPIFAGLVMSEVRSSRKPGRRRLATRSNATSYVSRAAIAAAALVAVSGIIGSILMWAADAKVDDATRASSLTAEANVRTAITIWPLLEYRRGLANLLAQRELADESATDALRREVDESFAYLDQYELPSDMLVYARVLIHRGDRPGAEGVLEEARRLDPYNSLIQEALDGVRGATAS